MNVGKKDEQYGYNPVSLSTNLPPSSSLADQALRHLEVVEEHERRGSSIFSQSQNGGEFELSQSSYSVSEKDRDLGASVYVDNEGNSIFQRSYDTHNQRELLGEKESPQPKWLSTMERSVGEVQIQSASVLSPSEKPSTKSSQSNGEGVLSSTTEARKQRLTAVPEVLVPETEIETAVPSTSADRPQSQPSPIRTPDVLKKSDQLNETSYYSAFESPLRSEGADTTTNRSSVSFTSAIGEVQSPQDNPAEVASKSDRDVVDDGSHQLPEMESKGGPSLEGVNIIDSGVHDLNENLVRSEPTESSPSPTSSRSSPQTQTQEQQTPIPSMESKGVVTQTATASQSTGTETSTRDSATSAATTSRGIETSTDTPTFHMDAGVQAQDNVHDLLNSLENWLDESTDLLESQGPPSAFPKAIRTQLQGYTVQLKLIEDKQETVAKFMRMVDRIVPRQNDTTSDYFANNNDIPNADLQLRQAADNVDARYLALMNGVHFRRQQLTDTLALATDFHSLVNTLKQWIDVTSDKVSQLCKVVTTPEEIEQSLVRQSELEQEIKAKGEAFDEIARLYTELVKVVGPEDENELGLQVHSMHTRYERLCERCENCEKALASFSRDVCGILAESDGLAEWLDQIEEEFAQLERIPLDNEELLMVSTEFSRLAGAINERQELVMRIVDDSRELCTNTSGAEALSMSQRIDRLQARYNALLNESVRRIDVFESVIRLSDELTEMVDPLEEFLDDCDDAFNVLDESTVDEQLDTLARLEEMLHNNAESVEEVEKLSVELRSLSKDNDGADLIKRSDELRERFAAVRALVDERIRRLQFTGQQTRETFDAVDQSLEFFAASYEQIANSERPPADIDQLKELCRQQRTLNERVASERVVVRELAAEAHRVVREANVTLGAAVESTQMDAKVERLRRLVEETAEAGAERMAILEQTLELCKELVPAYEESNDELARLECEFQTCTEINTVMPQEELRQQQIHNNQMLQAVQNEKRNLTKFERNIDALSELCNDQDAAHLRQLCDQLLERFKEVSDAFRSRGQALDMTVEKSAHVGDRLDAFLLGMESARINIRNPDPIAARPLVLRRQIEDNAVNMQIWQQKEPTFQQVRAAALETLASSKDNDFATAELSHKIAALDELWLDVRAGYTARDVALREALPIADAFWQSAGVCQQLFKKQRADLTHFNESAGLYSSTLDLRNQFMHQVQQGLQQAELQFAQVNTYAQELLARVGDEERSFVEQQLFTLGNEWQWLQQQCDERQGRMGAAQDVSQQFYALADSLRRWVQNAEAQAQQIPEDVPQNVNDIRSGIEFIQLLRNDANEKKIQLGELTQSARDLCAYAQPQQGAKIVEQIQHLDGRFNRLYAHLAECEHRYENALLSQGQLDNVHDQLLNWVERVETQLNAVQLNQEDAKKIELEMTRMGVIAKDIAAHIHSFDELERNGAELVRADPVMAVTLKPKLDRLLHRWRQLQERARNTHTLLEERRTEANSRRSQLEKWVMFLDDSAKQVNGSKLVGALVETVQQQLNDLDNLSDSVRNNTPLFERDLHEARARLENGTHESAEDAEWLLQKIEPLEHLWSELLEKVEERRAVLEQALIDATDLESRLDGVSKWVADAEKTVASQAPFPRRPAQLLPVFNAQEAFVEQIQTKKTDMADLTNAMMEVQLKNDRRDAIYVKNQVVTLKNRVDKLLQQASDRAKSMETALKEAEAYLKDVGELRNWINRQTELFEEEVVDTATSERLREQYDQHQVLLEEAQQRQAAYEIIHGAGGVLAERAPKEEKNVFRQTNSELKREWEEFNERCTQRSKDLEEALAASGRFHEGLEKLLSWVDEKLPPLEKELNENLFHGDLETLDKLIATNRNLVKELQTKEKQLDIVRQRGNQILANGEEGADVQQVRQQLEILSSKWESLQHSLDDKESRLNSALDEAVDLTESARELQDKLDKIEARVRRETSVTTDDDDTAQNALNELEKIHDDFSVEAESYNKVMGLVHDLLPKAHHSAKEPVQKIADQIGERWQQVSTLFDEREQQAKDLINRLQSHNQNLAQLGNFVEELQDELATNQHQCDNIDDLGEIQELILKHDEFKKKLRERQPLVEEVVEIAQRSSNQPMSASQHESAHPSRKAAPSRLGKSPLAAKRLLGDKANRSKRQRRSDQLDSKWQHLCQEAVSLEDRLKERRAHIEEVQRLQSFTFVNWRDRYLAWIDATKARHSDLFRQIDKLGQGQVSRKEFIDGVLRTKFPTTRLEMERVADEFDKNGMISSREFQNALRYVGERHRLPAPLGGIPRSSTSLKPRSQVQQKVEREKIANELKREAQQCKCHDHFRIAPHQETKGGAVKYAFGDSSMKRMVRILHSTVMVRVGGGWEELSSFLRTHDPCRAKGRTNIELNHGHEFVMPSATPAGASDVMSTFGSRKSSAVSNSGRSTPRRPAKYDIEGIERLNQGPVIKVREKTERSIPMFKKPYTPTPSASLTPRSYSRQASDLSSRSGPSTRIPRPSSYQNLASSRPSSRASDVSELSTTPSRIPTRARPNVDSATRPSSRQSNQQ